MESTAKLQPATRFPTLVHLLTSRSQEIAPQGLVWLGNTGVEVKTLDYHALDVEARMVAARLQRTFPPGARAMLLYGPGLEYVAGFFGSVYAGMIAVPAYAPRSTRDWPRLQAIIASCEPAVALTSKNEARSVQQFLAACGQPIPALVTHGGHDDLTESWQNPQPRPNDLAYLQYTSGSTSTPRGVMVSHANVMANLEYMTSQGGFDDSSIIATWLPLFHDMGLVYGALLPIYNSLLTVMFAPASFVQRPVRWLQTISRYRVTHSGGPNFAYDLCVRRVKCQEKEQLDLSCWRVAFSGSEPIHHRTLERFDTAFRDCGFRARAFYPVYGLAEATLKVTGARLGSGATVAMVDPAALVANRVEDTKGAEARAIVGCGRTDSFHTVTIVDPESSIRLPACHIGEIWVSGPSVAQGYWGRNHDSNAIFRARLAGTGDGPFLRTGDLGFVRDGELFVTGRLKDLIIVGGQNYYPQDIERSIEAVHPAFSTAAAFSVDGDDSERLVVVIEIRPADASSELLEAAVRAVAQEHQLPIDTAILVRRGAIPRTSSGKIQRHLCRSRFLCGDLAPLLVRNIGSSAAMVPRHLEPQAENDELSLVSYLRRQCAAMLKIEPEQITVDAPLASLGFDSLMATELAHTVQAELGISVVPGHVFLAGDDIRSLAGRLGVLTDPGVETACPTTRVGRFPLTASQRALWLFHGLTPRNPTLNMARCVRARSPFDLELLQAALRRAVRRHPALRTTYEATSDGPIQIVQASAKVDFETVDCPRWGDHDLRIRMAEVASEPFDLERGPLMRVRLFQRSPDEHFLLLVLHHLICDAWSLGVLCREFSGYHEESGRIFSGTAVHVESERKMLASSEGERLWHYWREQLSRDVPPLWLNEGRASTAMVLREAQVRQFRIEGDAAGNLLRFARERGTTTFTLLLAVLEVLLYQQTGQHRFLIAVPTHSRYEIDLQDEIGYFVALTAICADISDDPRFEELCSRVTRAAKDALLHSALPFAAVAERMISENSSPPRIQVIFAYQGTYPKHEAGLTSLVLGLPGGRFRLGAIEVESFPLPRKYTQFELTVSAAEIDGLIVGSFECDRAVFEPYALDSLVEGFIQLAAALPGAQCRLSSLPAVTQHERKQQLEWWNSNARPYNLDLPLQAHIEAAATRWPKRTALVSEGGTLEYGEMNATANRVAHRLRRLGVASESVVGLCAERSAEMVLGALAILKAGGAYLPLDPHFPSERTRCMVRQARCRTVLCQPSWRHLFDGCDVDILPLESGLASVEDEPSTNPTAQVLPDNPAYVIFTSGSTGTPKGVVNTHRGICNLLLWMQEHYDLSSDDTVLHKTPFTFDVSVWEFFWPLIAGARVVISPPAAHRDSSEIAELIARERVTTVHFVPSMLRMFLSDPASARCTSLRRVMVGGEELPQDLHDLFFRVLRADLHHVYGPTEAAVDVSAYMCSHQSGTASVPIGRPIANVRIYIVDVNIQLRPCGQAGELCIAGPCLARGYTGSPALTASRFVPDPFSGIPGCRMYRTGDLARYRSDGTIEFLGRLDHQVKIRGVRIEVGEIEAALRQHAAVTDCVVVARQMAPGSKDLIAYFVAGESLSARELRAWLRERLPQDMLPSRFVPLAAMPLNTNGKINRAALPPPHDSHSAAVVPPRTPIEALLATIWEEVLACRSAGSDSDFFELGGHSLHATQLLSRIRQRFDIQVPLASVFTGTNTIAAQAALIERLLIEKAGREGVEAALRRISQRSEQGTRDPNAKPDLMIPSCAKTHGVSVRASR